MKTSHILFLVTVLSLCCLPTSQASEEYIYYSDQKNPPTTDREPPFKLTRKKVPGDFGYLSIRYPSQKPGRDKSSETPLTMKMSVGNGLLKDLPIFFQVKKLELRYDGQTLELEPSFYNEVLKKRVKGMESLLEYRHIAPSHLHRRIDVTCLDCKPEYKQMLLLVEVFVEYLDKAEVLRENILLYQGTYHHDE